MPSTTTSSLQTMSYGEWQTVPGTARTAGEGSQPRQPAARRRRPIVLMCVGLVGSGKSTVASAIEEAYPSEWVRCNQDELGRRQAVEARVRWALERGMNAIVDRTNADANQRRTWIDIALEYGAEVVALVFDTPYEECLHRLQTRTGHPTLRSVQQATSILQTFARQLVLPSPNAAGIDRVILLPPSAYSPRPLLDEVERILERVCSGKGEGAMPSRAEMEAAQLRARAPATSGSRSYPYTHRQGYDGAGRRYVQQQLPYRPGQRDSHGGYASSYRPNQQEQARPPPWFSGQQSAPAPISIRDPARSYAAASRAPLPLYSDQAMRPAPAPASAPPWSNPREPPPPQRDDQRV